MTIRERDTMKQERVALDQVEGYFAERLRRLLTGRAARQPSRPTGGRAECSACRRASRRPALSAGRLTTAAALALAGCSSDGRRRGRRQLVVRRRRRPRRSASASPSPSSTVPVPEGVELTDQGSELSFGDAGDGGLRAAPGPGHACCSSP